MSTIVSIRLDDETESLLRRLARSRGQTRSALMRDAVAVLAERESAGVDPLRRPYEAMSHLIGCVRGGPSDLSTRTGERFRRLLDARQTRLARST